MVKPTGPANVSITRGDVWLAALDPTVGSEIQKTRPCVIYRTRDARLPADRDGRADDNRQPAGPFSHSGQLPRKNGLILLDQLRTLDKQRLVRRLGAVQPRTFQAALMRLRDIFAE